MKLNVKHMLAGCLCLGIFFSISCAKHAPPAYADASAAEIQQDEAAASGLEGQEASAAEEDEEAAAVKKYDVPNFNVNVVQVNKEENNPVTNQPAKEVQEDVEMSAPLEAASEKPAPRRVSAVVVDPAAEQEEQIRAAVRQRTPSAYRVYSYMPDSSKSLGTESLLSEISKEVAGKVFYELKEEGERNFTAKVAVVAAVPLADLKRETEFGRIMAEYLLTDLADRGLKVTELRLGREINILPQTGEFIMSRNIGELANNAPELDYVVVTTFSNTRKTLIVQGRLVSLKDGLVKTSWRYGMPINRELLALFHTVEQPFRIAVKGMGK